MPTYSSDSPLLDIHNGTGIWTNDLSLARLPPIALVFSFLFLSLSLSLSLLLSFCYRTSMLFSVTRLGYFLNIFVTNFLIKAAQTFRDIWAILKDINFKQKTAVLLFAQLWGKNWLLLVYMWSHWFCVSASFSVNDSLKKSNETKKDKHRNRQKMEKRLFFGFIKKTTPLELTIAFPSITWYHLQRQIITHFRSPQH